MNYRYNQKNQQIKKYRTKSLLINKNNKSNHYLIVNASSERKMNLIQYDVYLAQYKIGRKNKKDKKMNSINVCNRNQYNSKRYINIRQIVQSNQSIKINKNKQKKIQQNRKKATSALQNQGSNKIISYLCKKVPNTQRQISNDKKYKRNQKSKQNILKNQFQTNLKYNKIIGKNEKEQINLQDSNEQKLSTKSTFFDKNKYKIPKQVPLKNMHLNIISIFHKNNKNNIEKTHNKTNSILPCKFVANPFAKIKFKNISKKYKLIDRQQFDNKFQNIQKQRNFPLFLGAQTNQISQIQEKNSEQIQTDNSQSLSFLQIFKF